MATVHVSRTFGDLRQLQPSTRTLMQEIGALVIRRIRTRTEQEQGYDGKTFPALSAGYAKQKAKALGNTRADLTVSGRMLNEMEVIASTDTSLEIGWVSAGSARAPRGSTFIQRSRAVGSAEKAFFHTTGNHGVIRDFFGISDEDEDVIAAAIEEEAARRIAQL